MVLMGIIRLNLMSTRDKKMNAINKGTKNKRKMNNHDLGCVSTNCLYSIS